MNYRMVIYICGRIMTVEAFFMLLPFGVGLIYRESDAFAYLAVFAAMLLCGIAMSFKKPQKTGVYAREGLLIVTLAWVIMSLFGALPFTVTGDIPSYIDALFETVSGLTTTGASILTQIEGLSFCNLFWRSFSHWIGGMGVLVLILAILPQSETHSIYIMRAEVPGPVVGKLVSKIKLTARILYGIYIVMTVIEAVMLICGGIPVFDSITTSFATAGTGGFSVKNASIAAYDSVYAEMVIAVFMVLFGINFNVFYLMLIGKFREALKSEELHCFLLIIALSVGAIALNILNTCTNIWQALRYSFFTVTSIISTTGFSTADFNAWPAFSKIILVLLMFFGACAGSTGGGLKIARIIILVKSAAVQIRKMLFPRSVNSIKLEGKPVEDNVVSGVYSFLTVYLIIFVFSSLLLAFDNLDLVTNFTAVSACINNIGPGLEMVGPLGNYAEFSVLSKLILTFDMLAGRLEVFPMVVLFIPGMWKR